MNLPFQINTRGKLVEKSRLAFAGRVILPLFEIVENPTIRISDVKQRRFNLIDRATQKAKVEIQAAEDAAIFEIMDAAGDEAPAVWSEGPHDFWCEGCGEPRYKCYCDNICPYGCGKWEKDCLGDCQ